MIRVYGESRRKPGRAARNDIIMAEPWCKNNIRHDDNSRWDNTREHIKGAMVGTTLMQTRNPNAVQMQQVREDPSSMQYGLC